MNRKQIKNESKIALKGNRFMFLLCLIIVGAISSTGVGWIIAPVLVAGLFLVGKVLLVEKKFNFELLFEYFRDLNHAIKLFAVYFLYTIIVFGGLLLFIVPGIIFAYQFSQAIYIITENKDMDIWDAFVQSREMMKGYKWDLFVFQLSFFWHYVLGIITIGFYMLYAIPYIDLSMYNYYLHLKNKDIVVSA